MTKPKPTLDEMIDAAAKLPPSPDAWAPIFEAYPQTTVEEVVTKFRQSAERDMREARALRDYAVRRGLLRESDLSDDMLALAPIRSRAPATTCLETSFLELRYCPAAPCECGPSPAQPRRGVGDPQVE